MPRQLVIETHTGWQIRCRACRWHEIPKVGKPGASWTFNGDLSAPTFTPSINETVNALGPHHNPDAGPPRRCHFIISAGSIAYCSDCTHQLAGQVHQLEAWSDAEVKLAAARLKEPAP